MPITACFAVTLEPARRGVVWSTTYRGAREALTRTGLVTRDQFPETGKARSSSNGGHPEAGRWYVWQEQPQEDIWSITYYSEELFPGLSLSELRQLQRHLLNEFQITPESIGDMVLIWRAGRRVRAAQSSDQDESGSV